MLRRNELDHFLPKASVRTATTMSSATALVPAEQSLAFRPGSKRLLVRSAKPLPTEPLSPTTSHQRRRRRRRLRSLMEIHETPEFDGSFLFCFFLVWVSVRVTLNPSRSRGRVDCATGVDERHGVRLSFNPSRAFKPPNTCVSPFRRCAADAAPIACQTHGGITAELCQKLRRPVVKLNRPNLIGQTQLTRGYGPNLTCQSLYIGQMCPK